MESQDGDLVGAYESISRLSLLELLDSVSVGGGKDSNISRFESEEGRLMSVSDTGECRHSAMSSSLDMRVKVGTLCFLCLWGNDFFTGILVIARSAATDGARLDGSWGALVVRCACFLFVIVGLLCARGGEGISTGAVLRAPSGSSTFDSSFDSEPRRLGSRDLNCMACSS